MAVQDDGTGADEKHQRAEYGKYRRTDEKRPHSNCIFHPVGQKYQNSNQAVRIPFSAVSFSAK
ncbi:hypothetical protein B1A91_05115 [Neisseria meningitidis]|nr:hypothetical protein B1A92_03385 [Neisseria meningitidis]OOG99312.1 hypothetical protein B1A91_05115 [Neisseria meningitidis]